MTLTEATGTTLISGIPSQPVALHLCGRFRACGVKTTIGMLATVPGYQVTVYQHGFAEVAALLQQFGVKLDES